MYHRLVLAYYLRKLRKLFGEPVPAAWYKMVARFVLTGKIVIPEGWTLRENPASRALAVTQDIDENHPAYYPQLL